MTNVDEWSGPCPVTFTAEQLDAAIREAQAEALAAVKRACDIECKSPGKHTGCSSHEPYRALLASSLPSETPTP